MTMVWVPGGRLLHGRGTRPLATPSTEMLPQGFDAQVNFAEFTNRRLVRRSKGRCRPRRLCRLRRHLIRNT